MKLLARLEKKGQLFWTITGLALVAVVGIIDFLTGYELAFSLFYLLPVALVARYAGTKLGVVIAVVSGLCWFAADSLAGHPYSHPALLYLNSVIRFFVFLIVALLVSALKKAHEHERVLARIDSLTGAVNTRFFYELLQMEIERSERTKRPFTIVYFDLDNFKYINDHHGHSVGDKVLCATVTRAKDQLRKTDVVARLGGDEFTLLLPETDQAEARIVISKVHISLLDEMRRNSWPVTYSMGMLTCVNTPKTTDELVRQADALMYSVKKNGKNSINYSYYEE